MNMKINNVMPPKRNNGGFMQIFKVLVTLLISAIALPACASYSQQPSGYFSDPAQLALVEASDSGDINAMQRALDQGADPNAVGKDGMTPLFWSVTMNANLEAFRYMLAHGGDPNLVVVDESKSGVSTVYLLYQAYKNPDPAFIEAALEAGADPNTLVHEESTLLFESMSDEYIEQIRILIAHGADVNFRSKFGYTPLLNAVIGSEYKTALALLEAGADPELLDTHERSVIDQVKSMHDRQSGGDYRVFISALKEKGYLDPSY
ncbi:ankyrin repeat domain-containing protein [Vreelandella titanicae]|uniref:ankyrin repeat domain-containing protein n=1 Tax=Vreelandella titanicae TaxID=664683 RepID=UPI001F2C9800|nr:ankyrin repeat domain-containing protein [Halomonas titanicae]MCE7518344.1 ankyrin repeat domain-containing protein [Halomonas titanicae]